MNILLKSIRLEWANNILFSSAKFVGTEVLFMKLGKSFTYRSESRGPKTKRWGTQCLTLAQLETLLLLLLSLYMVILSLEAPKYWGNAEHRQMQVTGRVQYIAGIQVVLKRCRYMYINFQVINLITLCIIENSFGPLARESPCILLSYNISFPFKNYKVQDPCQWLHQMCT